LARKRSIKDTDYLYASARIKSIEKNLLSRDKLERMSEARTLEDALKLLGEAGWPEIASPTMPAVEEALASRRGEAFALIQGLAPDKGLTDVFLLKYDYHNVKVLLKSEATGEKAGPLLIDAGRIPCRQLQAMLAEGNFAAMSQSMGQGMAQAVAEAREVLAKTQDPQLLDILLDKAMYADMLTAAAALRLKYISGYVALLIDSANLRLTVRLRRMGKGDEALRQALVPGGGIPLSRLLTEITPEILESIYSLSPLALAAQAGARALQGEGSLADMDLACDDVLLNYLKSAKYVGFGAEPLVGYLAASEAELTAVRTVIAGKLAGLAPEMITERLRETYV
jgi:V/A-type H+-transporting ATPase subunit C